MHQIIHMGRWSECGQVCPNAWPDHVVKTRFCYNLSLIYLLQFCIVSDMNVSSRAKTRWRSFLGHVDYIIITMKLTTKHAVLEKEQKCCLKIKSHPQIFHMTYIIIGSFDWKCKMSNLGLTTTITLMIYTAG